MPLATQWLVLMMKVGVGQAEGFDGARERGGTSGVALKAGDAREAGDVYARLRMGR